MNFKNTLRATFKKMMLGTRIYEKISLQKEQSYVKSVVEQNRSASNILVDIFLNTEPQDKGIFLL